MLPIPTIDNGFLVSISFFSFKILMMMDGLKVDMSRIVQKVEEGNIKVICCLIHDFFNSTN